MNKQRMDKMEKVIKGIAAGNHNPVADALKEIRLHPGRDPYSLEEANTIFDKALHDR